MTDRKLDFSSSDWEIVSQGIRVKRFEQDGKVIRLVEMSEGLDHPEWCVTGHLGYVAKGTLEIIFDDKTETYSLGDGIFIKSGESQKHIPKPLSEKVILFLIDNI